MAVVFFKTKSSIICSFVPWQQRRRRRGVSRSMAASWRKCVSSRNIVRFAVAVVFFKKTNLTFCSFVPGNNLGEGEAPDAARNTAGLGWDVTINREGGGHWGLIL